MRSRRFQPRYLTLGGLIGIGCGIAMTALCGEHPVHDRAPPPNILNYPCMPRRETWGYYSPKWRRWPAMPVAAVPGPEDVDAGLPEVDRPPPEEEEQRAPAPPTRAVPLETGPAPEAAVPTPTGPAGPGLQPFEPTPAAEPPAAGPGAPLPSAPLPSTPFPGPGGQNGATPQPAPAPAPSPLNPFDGAEADPSRFEQDPPPALPPSLQSTLRLRDASRAARRQPAHSGAIAAVARLPGTASAAGSVDRYAVQQASATVWAAGTGDIRPSDPNAGRIEQAIHHEPVK